MPTISALICRYGTEESPVAPRVLRAGALSAELDAGNLRHIRYGGREILRAVSFIVRDRDWGTCAAQLHDIVIDEAAERFTVAYRAEVEHRGQRLAYTARIMANATDLTFSAQAHALTDFETNRTGFVVLHPLDGVVGQPARVEHADGSVEHTRFPDLISPLQPMRNLRAIEHQPAPGLRVQCRMTGDVFEMEDQRNWTDASYKTYVRPLALPWPYTLSAGDTVEQAVTLTVTAQTSAQPATSGAVTLTLGNASGVRLPALGVGLSHAELANTETQLARLAPLQPRHLVYHFDPRTSTVTDLARASRIAQTLGAEAWLEAVVVSVDGFEAEVADLGRANAALENPFKVVLVSPAADLKATLPGSPWPPAPPLADLYRAARRAFPAARLGGGMFSYFTELNRKLPPLDDLDLVTFTTTAILHAGDDATVVENLASLPSLTASVRQITGGKPFVVGPSAIGMRMNPYGEAPLRNLANDRRTMNENDPRQRGLLGAAWALGYLAQMARGGAHAVTLGGTTGAQGVLAVPQPWPQPYFDDHAGAYFPIFHVQRWLARRADSELLVVDASNQDERLAALAFADEAGDAEWELLVANLTPAPQYLALPGKVTGLWVLDSASFVAASQHADFFDTVDAQADTQVDTPSGGRLTLDAYAVARILLA